MCPTATIQQKLHAVQDILGRRQARSQSARAAELFDDSAELAHAQQLDAEQYSALEAQQDPEGTDDPPLDEDSAFGSFRAYMSPDASELLIDMPPHSIAGIGVAWDLLAAECVQGNKDGAEITLEGSVPTRNAFAQKLKDPPRLQCIYLPPTAADVTPLVGNLPIPEAGIMDSGASCTIVNNMESIPDARLLPKRIPFGTSGRVIVFATHYGTCDVIIVNTADAVPIRWRSYALYGAFSSSMFTLGVGGFATRVLKLMPDGKQIIHVVTITVPRLICAWLRTCAVRC